MAEWWTILSMAAAVAIGLAKTFSHCEKTRLEVMPRERRSYRSAMRVNKTSNSSAPWGR